MVLVKSSFGAGLEDVVELVDDGLGRAAAHDHGQVGLHAQRLGVLVALGSGLGKFLECAALQHGHGQHAAAAGVGDGGADHVHMRIGVAADQVGHGRGRSAVGHDFELQSVFAAPVVQGQIGGSANGVDADGHLARPGWMACTSSSRLL
jgi:hypothetical protein